MSTDTPYPSRRALREQGLTTGSIQALTETGSIPPQSEALPPPLTRRERRERERLAETGSLPFPLPAATPAKPVPEESPTETPATMPPQPEGHGENTSSSATTVVEPPTPATRPLTRRERREMERRGEAVPETGMIPVVTPDPVETEAETVREVALPEREEIPEQTSEVEQSPWSLTTTIPEETDEVVEQEAPASPVPTSVQEEPAGELPSDVAVPVEVEERPEPEPEPEPKPAALPPVFAPMPSTEVPAASSRQVSVASDQTNALILPVAPAMDLTGPMGDTGEVLVTGNIPLPKQVSEQAITGIVEVDSDEYDVTDTGTFSNPIRATQAVSSRSLELAQPMIRKPRWGAASIVLAFSSAVLAVAAVGLLALALMTDLIALP